MTREVTLDRVVCSSAENELVSGESRGGTAGQKEPSQQDTVRDWNKEVTTEVWERSQKIDIPRAWLDQGREDG